MRKTLCHNGKQGQTGFHFPQCCGYHEPEFAALRLTMLGVKSTFKDRWRQVLAEAGRTPEQQAWLMDVAAFTALVRERQDAA